MTELLHYPASVVNKKYFWWHQSRKWIDEKQVEELAATARIALFGAVTGWVIGYCVATVPRVWRNRSESHLLLHA